MMVFRKGGECITVHDLPPHFFSMEANLGQERQGRIQLAGLVADLEKRWITQKLKECGWNRERAASLLGITRKMLTDRMKKYRIQLPGKKRLHS
jgi:DNA-binding NtrC family response regulator